MTTKHLALSLYQLDRVLRGPLGKIQNFLKIVASEYHTLNEK